MLSWQSRTWCANFSDHHDLIRAAQDEPFHVPQAQAYCNGQYSTWDPKITTPPGLSVPHLLCPCSFSHERVRYVMSLLLHRVFLLKCVTPVLRYSVLLSLLALPLALTRLLCFYKRERPPASLLSPLPEAIVLSTFPVAWFFGFLYYTDVPSLISVVSTVVAASEDMHWTAAFVRNLQSFESLRLLMIR